MFSKAAAPVGRHHARNLAVPVQALGHALGERAGRDPLPLPEEEGAQLMALAEEQPDRRPPAWALHSLTTTRDVVRDVFNRLSYAVQRRFEALPRPIQEALAKTVVLNVNVCRDLDLALAPLIVNAERMLVHVSRVYDGPVPNWR